MRLATWIPSSKERATMIFPLRSMDSRAMSARSRRDSWTSSSLAPCSASARESVTSTAEAIRSCSAWESRSAATQAGLEAPSASTSTSEGPAIMSMFTWPKTCFFASAT